jgi:hypothetical protein
MSTYFDPALVIPYGLDVDKPDNPAEGSMYIATDKGVTFVCYSEGEWSNNPSGLDPDRIDNPLVGDTYIATDTKKSYVCYEAGKWDYFSILRRTQYSFEDSVLPDFITNDNPDWTVSFGSPYRTGSQSCRLGKSYTSSGTDINALGVKIDRVGEIDLYLYRYNDSYKKTTEIRVYDGDVLVETIAEGAQEFVHVNHVISSYMYIVADFQWSGLSSGLMGIVFDDLTVADV